MVTDRPLESDRLRPRVNGDLLDVTALQMGNPNCCIFVDSFESLDWRGLGRK